MTKTIKKCFLKSNIPSNQKLRYFLVFVGFIWLFRRKIVTLQQETA